jgi:hypothetical protein
MSGMTNPLTEARPAAPAPVPSPSRKKFLLFGLAAIVIVCGAVTAVFKYQAAEREKAHQAGLAAIAKTARVTRGDLEVRLRVTGQTSAREYYNITAPQMRGPDAASMVLLKLAGSGSMVRKGDLVAEIDPQSMRDNLDDAQDTLKDLENNVKKKRVNNELSTETLRQTLRSAKASLDKAKLDIQALDVRTPLDQESLKLSLEEAEATYKELQSNTPLTMESQRADLRITEITKLTQDLQIKRRQNDLNRLTFHAPMDGMVVVQTMNRPGGDQVTLAVGDTMRPGQQILKVINPNRMQVEGRIFQSEVTDLRIGQEARIELDAFPGVLYQGRVYALGALAVSSGRSQYYIRTVPIRVEILNPDKRVIPDLSAAANVLVKVEKNVLLVPSAAVERQGAESFVHVRTPNGFVRRSVKLGPANGVQVAVVEGVREGEEVRASN